MAEAIILPFPVRHDLDEAETWECQECSTLIESRVPRAFCDLCIEMNDGEAVLHG